jgi:RNA polymerase sigma-70 factor (sigma-E family)
MSVPEYDELYAAQRARLVRTAYAVSGDLGIAEDAVRTAFAKAYRSWRRISRLESPEAYVRRIVVNEVLSTRRRAALRHEGSRAEPPERTASGSPEDSLARDELWRAVRGLPPRQRAVLVLRYYEDLSERQIADALGCRPGTVKSQASAALAALRARLGDPASTPAGGEQA